MSGNVEMLNIQVNKDTGESLRLFIIHFISFKQEVEVEVFNSWKASYNTELGHLLKQKSVQSSANS